MIARLVCRWLHRVLWKNWDSFTQDYRKCRLCGRVWQHPMTGGVNSRPKRGWVTLGDWEADA